MQEDHTAEQENVSDIPQYIVPPGLEYSVEEFEWHCQVSMNKPIMIIGPTGVGKSLFLHLFKVLYKEQNNLIGKKDEEVPIITANCAHFEGANVRSELFGYVEGSFTGALKGGKEGLIKKANGGVLILEEIGTLPKDVQAMLLTFIETQKYYQYGGVIEEYADVQIIGATNDELTLRDDFRYRFSPFYIPPIHDRREDILYYLAFSHPEVINIISPYEVMSWLSYNWPGNVREIERLGGLIKRKILTMDSILKKKKLNNYTYSKWIKSIPKDLNVEDYIDVYDGSIYGFEKKQTDLDMFLPGRLFQKTSEDDDNLVLLGYFDVLLRTLHVGLEPSNTQPAFHQYPQNDRHEYIEVSDELSDRINEYVDKEISTNFSESCDEEYSDLFPEVDQGYNKFPDFDLCTVLFFDERYNLFFCDEKSIYGKAFERAIRGLAFFCKCFYRDIYSSKNVLDFENCEHSIPYIENVHPRGLKKKDRMKLQKNIFNFLSGIELKKSDKIPDGITKNKQFLEDLQKKYPDNDFLNALLSDKKVRNDKIKQDVSWNKDYNTLSKEYFERLLIITNGNTAEAARRANLKRTTFTSKLRRLGIPLGYGKNGEP